MGTEFCTRCGEERNVQGDDSGLCVLCSNTTEPEPTQKQLDEILDWVTAHPGVDAEDVAREFNMPDWEALEVVEMLLLDGKLQAGVDLLLDVLAQELEHRPGCQRRNPVKVYGEALQDTCSCGLDEILQQIRTARGT
jgi:hypothetical protein